MKKILILCILLLVLVPATVMATGAHKQGKSSMGEPASAIQEQSLEPAPVSGQNGFCLMNGQENNYQYRFAEMHRMSAGRGIGDQVRIMARNQTRLQDGIGDQVRIMARNQTRLRDGSCENCRIQTG
jgi:hypothetical protein